MILEDGSCIKQDCFATLALQRFVSANESLNDLLLGDNLLDLGIDEFIDSFLTVPWPISLLFSLVKSLGFFKGKIRFAFFIGSSVTVTDLGTANISPGLPFDFDLHAFMAFSEGLFGHRAIPRSSCFKERVAM